MKRRKRMGLPKVRAVTACRTTGTPEASSPRDVVDVLQERMRATPAAVRPPAARPRIVEAAPDQPRAETSTPEKLAAFLERHAEPGGRYTPAQRALARKLGF